MARVVVFSLGTLCLALVSVGGLAAYTAAHPFTSGGIIVSTVANTGQVRPTYGAWCRLRAPTTDARHTRSSSVERRHVRARIALQEFVIRIRIPAGRWIANGAVRIP